MCKCKLTCLKISFILVHGLTFSIWYIDIIDLYFYHQSYTFFNETTSDALRIKEYRTRMTPSEYTALFMWSERYLELVMQKWCSRRNDIMFYIVGGGGGGGSPINNRMSSNHRQIFVWNVAQYVSSNIRGPEVGYRLLLKSLYH